MEFAKSLSGHDKNQYYLILEEDGEFVFLVNGSTRTLQKPKKKNRKHIQPVKKIPAEAEAFLKQEITDISIRKALKTYENFVINKVNAAES